MAAGRPRRPARFIEDGVELTWNSEELTNRPKNPRIQASYFEMKTLFARTVVWVAANFLLQLHGAIAGERGLALRTALSGADTVVVARGKSADRSVTWAEFRFVGQAKIAELVAQLDFDDAESGFHCMCAGDAQITFRQGERVLAEISHHHGRSLRWASAAWAGDSLFTAAAAQAWPAWFRAQGEGRFEAMLESDRAEREKQKRIAERFMRPFPEGAAAIFAEAERDFGLALSREEEGHLWKELGAKLTALFPNRPSAAVACAQALGSHCLAGGWEGSWSGSTAREQLVLQFAESWSASEFGVVLAHPDVATQLGAARLFYFQGLNQLLPAAARPAAAARLAEVVFREDRWQPNADSALRGLSHYRGPEVNALLERLALGEIALRAQPGKEKEDPTLRVAACLYLARTKSPRSTEALKRLEQQGPLDEIDTAALLVARSFLGERGNVTPTVLRHPSWLFG